MDHHNINKYYHYMDDPFIRFHQILQLNSLSIHYPYYRLIIHCNIFKIDPRPKHHLINPSRNPNPTQIDPKHGVPRFEHQLHALQCPEAAHGRLFRGL